ncbi:MAG: superoxide dismutase [Bacteroidales bacterium]|nr:superoxide dismutase [Bacteroidales bacterium]
MSFSLIDLPYAPSALEPVISAATIGFHHGKHLQTYVNNLNALLPGTQWENLPLEEIVKGASGGVFNNAGQILNHNLYFLQFQAPKEGNVPVGKLAAQIDAQWGSFDEFKKAFAAAGGSLFGSGWVWLGAAPDGSLQITQESGAGNPVTKGLKPILTFDVWEHAYYLDYQNRRPAYMDALWSILNWEELEKRYTK